MDFTFIYSTAILFLMLMDPFGNLPLFMSILKNVPHTRQRRVIARELLIALVVMLLSLTAGQAFFGLLHIEAGTLTIAGGIILFLTGIKMVFSSLAEPSLEYGPEPFIVPLAVPLVCGPGLIALLATVHGSSPSASFPNCFAAVFLAWIIQFTIMMSGHRLARVLGSKALDALESLMGLLLTCIAVGMIIQGINRTYGFRTASEKIPPVAVAPATP